MSNKQVPKECPLPGGIFSSEKTSRTQLSPLSEHSKLKGNEEHYLCIRADEALW